MDSREVGGEDVVGLDYIVESFGNISLTQIIAFGCAIAAIIQLYRIAKKYFVQKYEVEKERREEDKQRDIKLNYVLDEVNKYPQYREKSREIQKELRGEIQTLSQAQKEIYDALKELQEDFKVRERNKLRDKLLQSYRYYTKQTHWTTMEAEAFWALFKDYEDAGGDGYMHTVVQPAMNLLQIIEIDQGE